ncbi:MAG: calcium-binding protein [Gemmobacter sp.]
MPEFILTTGSDIFPGPADNSGDDTIFALAGDDIVYAGNGNDILFGGDGIDTLYGGAGDDSIDLGLVPTSEAAFGGTGVDTLVLDYGLTTTKITAQFSTGAWSVLLDGLAGPTLDGFDRMEVNGSVRRDVLIGGNLGDVLIGNGGNDRLRGSGGDDDISDSWGVYDADGGTGNDILRVAGTNAKDRTAGLTFDALAGTISAGTSASGIFVNFERYEVEGTGRGDTIVTGDLDDGAAGLTGNDNITLGGGNDVGDGGAGADRLYGGTGNDTLYAGAPAATAAQQKDRLYGGDGDDLLSVETHSPGALFTYLGAVWDGGTGTDRLEFESTNAVLDLTGATLAGIETIAFSTALTFGLRVNLGQVTSSMNFDVGFGTLEFASGGILQMFGNLNMAAIRLFDGGQNLNIAFSTRTAPGTSASLIGGSGNDTIGGSARDEAIFGNGGDDLLVGNEGIDTIDGGAGNDTIYGSNGNDRIIGGGGGDLLYGASGGPINKDIFDYNAATDSGVAVGTFDTIGDFLVAGGGGVDFIDRFDLSTIDAMAGGFFNDTFSFIGTVGFTAEGQVRATQSGLDTLVELNIAGTSGAEMSILLIDFVATNLTQYDFFL